MKIFAENRKKSILHIFMHIIFSILINLANLEQNLEKSGGAIANPANPANPEKQINLTRNIML